MQKKLKQERSHLHDTQAHFFTINCNKYACMQVIQNKIQHDNSLKELVVERIKSEHTPIKQAHGVKDQTSKRISTADHYRFKKLNETKFLINFLLEEI